MVFGSFFGTHFNVGVIGLSGSGRSHLIEALKANVSTNTSVDFHKLDYPDKGRSQTSASTYDNHIKQIKSKHNLSLLLLVAPGSFRDKESVLISAANKIKLPVAIVVTRFDEELSNINPRTKKFTPKEKDAYKANEKNHILRYLKDYTQEMNPQIFHVSYFCFSSMLDHESQPFCQDENLLCSFVKNYAEGTPDKFLQDFSHQNIGQAKADEYISTTVRDLPDSYDIVLVGVKNSGLSETREALKQIFTGKVFQNIQYNDQNSASLIVKKLEDIPCKIIVFVVKGNPDANFEDILRYLKNSSHKFVVVLNTKNPNTKSTLISYCQSISYNEFIFALDLEHFESCQSEDKYGFIKVLENQIGEATKKVNVLERQQTFNTNMEKPQSVNQPTQMSFRQDVLLVSFNNAFISPIGEILTKEIGAINIKFMPYNTPSEILNERDLSKMIILVIPSEFLSHCEYLISQLNSQRLEYITILDATKALRTASYSIKKERNKEHCYTLTCSYDSSSNDFIQFVKSQLYPVNNEYETQRYNLRSTTLTKTTTYL